MPPSDAATNAPGTTSAATPVAGYWPGTPTEEETVAEAATAAAPGDEVRARPTAETGVRTGDAAWDATGDGSGTGLVEATV